MSRRYLPAAVSPNFAELEEIILTRWAEGRIFEKSMEQRPREIDGVSNEFVFYDGPPFANGLPHYGHIVTGYMKDLVPRYQTMKGRHVSRRFGWDCHGLPAELAVEKEIGVSGAKAIQGYGIAKFNDACRASVQRYTDDWRWYVNRQGRWVSFEQQYKTMDRDYMESVLWAFKQLWDKGLIYEGYRVVPYSWAVQTPLSNFETRLDDAYRERADATLTVGFLLKESARFGADPVRLLAWTTTPWTLPSNMALCVNPDFVYLLMAKEGESERLLIAKNARERYARELEGYAVVEEVAARDLVGLGYVPLFPYFAEKEAEGAFRIVSADFVDAESGTGVVHIAPGFGEDDMELSKTCGIPVVVPVDDAGRFTDEVSDYAGLNVIHEANARVIHDLKEQGVVLKHDQIVHSYPHCWRTDEPLIYKAVSSWYLEVTKFRDRMVELNQGIQWVPDHIKDGVFGNWLANARDWNLSRNRFWGAPIPVWKSDDDRYPRVDVYGSIEELERDFGVTVKDLHRPAIDELVRPNPDDPTGQSMMRRVPEVLDCWFESGSMPYAQVHYPFENRERFEANFPGDFIVEYIAQTRGWFYTLMVLSTALFDRAPFKSCVCHGVVLDENSQKLSKRLQNYPDPVEVLGTLGSDALRWYLLSSPLMVGGDLAMSRDDGDIVKAMRPAILRLWNAYSFFTLYANADGIEGHLRSDSTHVLDVFILGKTAQMVRAVEACLDGFDIPGAYGAVVPFVDALNNWYIRNRRDVFWAEENSADKQAAYDTLYTVLVTVCRALAPMMPFIAEHIHSALTDEESVHLMDWPDVSAFPVDEAVLSGMDLAREVCSAVLRVREAKRRRVRLPLKSLVIAHPDVERLRPYVDLIRNAVNIVSVDFSDDPAAYGTRAVKVNSQLGKVFGAKFKDILAAQRAGDWTLREDGVLEIAGEVLQDFEMRYVVESDSEALASDSFDAWRGLVQLDVTVYPELEAEGWARDLIRLIQQTRKEKDLVITDRIRVKVAVPEAMRAALSPFVERIAGEVLAVSFDFVEAAVSFADDAVVQGEIGEAMLTLSVILAEDVPAV